MPPCSLHHSPKACIESCMPLFSPGFGPVTSAMVPTWISVSVTPGAVAPLASPGPQGDSIVNPDGVVLAPLGATAPAPLAAAPDEAAAPPGTPPNSWA